MALGAATVLCSLIGGCAMFLDVVRSTRLWPTGLVVLQFLEVAHTVGIRLASVLGLGVLPFCLLRMADRAVPAPTTPEDAAKVRRMETWTSTAFSAGVALTALDALRTLLNIVGFLGLFSPMGLFPAIGLLVSSVFPSVVMLCILVAVRAMLRCLMSDQWLPDKPGRWSMPIAIVVTGCGLGAVGMVQLFRARGGEMAEILFSHTMIVMWFQFLLQSAQFIIVAALLRLLPVGATWYPAPAPGPDSAAARRVLRIVLALIALLAVRCVWKAVPRILPCFAEYAERNHLPAKFCQEPGWDPVPLPPAGSARLPVLCRDLSIKPPRF